MAPDGGEIGGFDLRESTRKLALSRETVRELDGGDLRKVNGGQATLNGCLAPQQTLFCSELPSCLCSSLPCGGPGTN
jgi:hypothetical protein